ncbi:MAG TPA: type II toxin-antitoxin system RelE/ParE family toxin [Candidatus Limosilactobacillus faecipullorum]|nr:type II toxin-antitoxin system RelE/ParE family toxin [Candidatus Limosilactobacillus faecipullorum]
MDNWIISYAAEARSDLIDIDSYIRFALLAPTAADRIVDKITHEVRSLSFMPNRHTVYPNEPWHDLGVRFLPVEKYLIFYYPDADKKTVKVLRILYGGRNINTLLPTKLD